MTNTIAAATPVAEYVHPWEAAGLGRAPFRWLGVERKVGPIRIANADGTTTEIGSAGQPMGSCAFCGQGIAECHSIRSADGREFIVGCDCVRRVEDKGSKVLKAAEQAARDLRNTKARERGAVKAKASKAELAALLASPELRAALSARPSAYAWRAAEGATALDDAEWLASRCGHSGRVRLIKSLQAQR